MRFPTFALVGLLSEHISAVSVCVSPCVLYKAPRSLWWKISPESIYISPHELGLCLSLTLGTECRLPVMVAFLKHPDGDETHRANRLLYLSYGSVMWFQSALEDQC